MAIIGIIFVIYLKKYKKYIFYILWPITTFLLVIIYKLTGISYLSPYQRNLYYFALGLPIFSAIGLYSIIKITQNKIYQLIIEEKELIILKKFSTLKVNFKINKKYVKFTHFAITGIITFIILATVGTLSFFNYYNLPFEVHLYQVINKKEYGALNFLKSFPRTRVMATPFVSTALYPITGHDPIGTLTYFGYGDRQIIELFFTRDCNVKKEIIKSYEIGYVISPILLECDNLELIYNQENNFIYKTN